MSQKQDGFEQALRMLDVFTEIGLTLTPSEPTRHMCRIGAQVGNVDEETARKIYRFMMDATLDEYSVFED